RAISLLREEKNKQDWLIVAQVIWSETRKHWEAVCQEVAGIYDTSIQKVFLGPGDRYISKERFLDLIKGGCAHCNDPLFLTDEQELNWIKDDRPIGAKCWNSPEFWSSPACGLSAHPNAVI